MLSEKPWLPEEVLLLLIRLFASMFIGLVLISLLNSSHWLGASELKFLTLLVGALSFHGMALLLTHAFLRKQTSRWTDAFGFGSPRLGRTLLLSFLVTFASLPIVRSLGQLSAKIMEKLDVETVVQGPVQVLQTTDLVQLKMLIGVLAMVVAPFAEEVIFRGIIYPVLKQHGYPRLALWGTSLLFAAIHGNLVILLPLTFLAVVLTLLYETTDNLLAPIIAHSLFNFVNFFWVIVQPARALLAPT
jgi:membrane protease YdiL (CAAX protease family)